MPKCLIWVVLALLGLGGCGGNVSVPPPAPFFATDAGPPPAGPDDPGPGPDPGPAPVSALNGQLWTSTDPVGPQRRVVVTDDFDVLGWWVEQPDSGPPVYGVFTGALQAESGTDRFSTSEMASMRLPVYGTSFAPFSMGSPQSGLSQARFDADPGTAAETLRADALAHESLPLAQRSGRYAGELPLAGHREPVSLQWAADGSFALSLTRLPQNACAATGQVSPLANAPARLLAFTLSFSGTACPAIEIPNASPSQPATVVPLSTLSFSGAIDAASADAFVLFGSDGIYRIPLLLPATRVSAPALPGAWSGGFDDSRAEFHIAVLDDLSILGWYHDPMLAGDGPAHAVVLGSLPTPAPGASSFGGGELRMWIPSVITTQVPNPGFTGPLPVSDTMRGSFGSSPANIHAVPLAQQALPTAERRGVYTGELQLPLLRVPTTLNWGADGSLNLILSGYPACALSGRADPLAGGPARWLSFQLSFSGSGCPVVLYGQINLSGITVRGGIDASSGDEFVLFGLNDNRQVSMVLPARRVP